MTLDERLEELARESEGLASEMSPFPSVAKAFEACVAVNCDESMTVEERWGALDDLASEISMMQMALRSEIAKNLGNAEPNPDSVARHGRFSRRKAGASLGCFVI